MSTLLLATLATTMNNFLPQNPRNNFRSQTIINNNIPRKIISRSILIIILEIDILKIIPEIYTQNNHCSNQPRGARPQHEANNNKCQNDQRAYNVKQTDQESRILMAVANKILFESSRYLATRLKCHKSLFILPRSFLYRMNPSTRQLHTIAAAGTGTVLLAPPISNRRVHSRICAGSTCTPSA